MEKKPEQHIVNIFYNGFNIIGEGCDYKIKGLPSTFKTLELAKNAIDLMKNNKPPTKTKPFFY